MAQQKMKINGKVFALQAPYGAAMRVISLVGGPHPYLWIGEEDGEFFGATLSTDDLRKLRDEITKALRHAE